jgi:hypothetical protein
MSRISLPKLVLVLILATVLAAPSTGWAGSRRFSNDSTWAGGSVTTNLMVAFWSYVTGLWGKEGCGLDPSGRCKADAGCGIDPHGLCGSSTATSPTTAKEGCGIDPDGRCTPTLPSSGSGSTTDAGWA